MVDIIVVLFALVGLAAIVNEILKNSGVYEMSIFKRYWNYMNTWREHRRIIKELNALTDRELTDIGISRSDINRLVWLEEDKTMRNRGENE
jgi:uncharacterized protein YjiS (DUF1127 family)